MRGNMKKLLLCVLVVFNLSVLNPVAGNELKHFASAASRAGRAQRQRVTEQIKTKSLALQQDKSGITVVKSGNLSNADRPWQISATSLGNGNTFVAWQDLAAMAGQQDKGAAGYGVMLNKQMQQVGPNVIYTDTSQNNFIGNNTAVSFAHGNVLVAYSDGTDGDKGKFVVFNPQMRIIKGPFMFNDTKTESVFAIRLAGGNAILLAYHRKQGVSGSGKLKIIDSAGNVMLQERTFSPNGLTSSISAGLLSDGLVFMTYTCGFSNTKVLDPYGYVVRSEKRMPGTRLGQMTPCVLNNGNVFLAHSAGECLVFNESGDIISGPHDFTAEGVSRIMLTKLDNGNIFLSTIDAAGKVTCRVIDSEGKVIRGPKTLDNSTSSDGKGIAQTNFPGNMVLIIFGGRNPNYMILK